jgi:hypothetical protein
LPVAGASAPPGASAVPAPPPQLSLPWHPSHLATLLKWFKSVDGLSNTQLAFAASLSKAERGMVHKQAEALGLPTLSRGTEPNRYISVLAPGIPAQRWPRTRPVELVHLWGRHGEAAAEVVAGLSLDELAERAHTGNLSPDMQALLERARGVTGSVYCECEGTGVCGCNGRGGTGAAGRPLGCGLEAVVQGGGRKTPGTSQRRQTAPDVAVGRVEAERAQRRFRCLTELRRGGIRL